MTAASTTMDRCVSGTRPCFRYAPLLWLAFGTFAVGTEAFMIAAILLDIAADVRVSVQAAGQLVTIFSLTYAFTSPVLTAITSNLDRRTLLLLSMTAFAVSNALAALSSDYWLLAAARVLLAASAGLFVPAANALAGAIAPPAQRGRALAIINGGISLAVALGVPLGAFVGAHAGWRMTFAGVAVLSTVALAGLWFGIPRDVGANLPVASLRERLTMVRQKEALLSLLVTTLWAAGGFTVYTYIASVLAAGAGLEGAQIGAVLFAWGAAAFVGLFVGGLASDRFGARRVIAVELPIMAAALFGISLSIWYAAPSAAWLPILFGVIVWGVTAWGFFPAQQSRLMSVTGLAGAPIILSLNASFQYLGFSIGAALGSVVLSLGGVADLGWVGALCVLAALMLSLSLRTSSPSI